MTCPKAGRDHRTGDLAAQILTGLLSAAGSTEFEVEFGIDLAAEAGAVTPRARWARTPRGGRDPPPALDPLPPPARVPCLDRHPGERDALAGLDADAEPASRTALPAHVTCSAVVIDRHRRVLHVRHKASGGLLLATGGHVEADDDTLLTAALREVKEEAGIPASALVLRPDRPDAPAAGP
ncbi:NUDIX domain-containing protein [Streptomyces rishiriensis]|uniref:NUDIX domain-containing protein n=1 Tax=Streptomyces rishiriensis TaxID=68264 RepID=UPI0033C69A12